MKKQNSVSVISTDIVVSSKTKDLDRELSLPIPLKSHTLFMSLKVFQVKCGCLTEREFVTLIKNQNKMAEAKTMTNEAFSFFKDFFIGEPTICSHLFDGINVFLVYEAGKLQPKYLCKSDTGFISEEVISGHHANLKTFIWMLDLVRIQNSEELKGSFHKASISLGIRM